MRSLQTIFATLVAASLVSACGSAFDASSQGTPSDDGGAPGDPGSVGPPSARDAGARDAAPEDASLADTAPPDGADASEDTGAPVDAATPNPIRFTLSAAPASLTLVIGQAATVTVTVTRQTSFPDAISIALVNPPAGITADVLTIPGGAPTGTLTLHAAATAPLGVRSLTLRGTAGGVSADASVQVAVPPAGCTTLAPDDALFVAPDGADVKGCGTQASPCRTIDLATRLAYAGKTTVRVAAGEYPGALKLTNDVLTVLGGHKRVSGVWGASCADARPVVRSSSHDPAISVDSSEDQPTHSLKVTLADLDLFTKGAADPGESLVGLYVGYTDLLLRNVNITASPGGKGADGSAGSVGVAGGSGCGAGNGASGGAGVDGAGGAAGSAGGFGGSGGTGQPGGIPSPPAGANGSTCQNQACVAVASTGTPGTAGCGGAGGTTGGGGGAGGNSIALDVGNAAKVTLQGGALVAGKGGNGGTGAPGGAGGSGGFGTEGSDGPPIPATCDSGVDTGTKPPRRYCEASTTTVRGQRGAAGGRGGSGGNGGSGGGGGGGSSYGYYVGFSASTVTPTSGTAIAPGPGGSGGMGGSGSANAGRDGVGAQHN